MTAVHLSLAERQDVRTNPKTQPQLRGRDMAMISSGICDTAALVWCVYAEEIPLVASCRDALRLRGGDLRSHNSSDERIVQLMSLFLLGSL
jgi:hypothetical protein